MMRFLTVRLLTVLTLLVICFPTWMQEGSGATSTPYPCHAPEIVPLWSKDGEYLVVATRLETLVYQVSNLSQPAQNFPGACNVRFSESINEMLLIENESWNVMTGQQYLPPTPSSVQLPQISPAGNYEITFDYAQEGGSSIITLKHLKTPDTKDIEFELDAKWHISRLVFSKDESRVAIPVESYIEEIYETDEGTYVESYVDSTAIYIWDIDGGSKKFLAELPDIYTAKYLAFSDDGQSLLVANGYNDYGSDGYGIPLENLNLWDIGSGEKIQRWDSYSYEPIERSPTGRWMLYVIGTEVLLWDHQTVRSLNLLEDERFSNEGYGGPSFYFYEEDTKMILTTLTNIYFWDMNEVTEEVIPEPAILTFDSIDNFALSKDKSLMIVNQELWDVKTLQPVGSFEGLFSQFSRDNLYMVTYNFTEQTRTILTISNLEPILTVPATMLLNPEFPYLVYPDDASVKVVDLTTLEEIEIPVNPTG